MFTGPCPVLADNRGSAGLEGGREEGKEIPGCILILEKPKYDISSFRYTCQF